MLTTRQELLAGFFLADSNAISMISEARFESGENLGAPAEISESPWVVMKFGGTSVSSAENWETIFGNWSAERDASLLAKASLEEWEEARKASADDAEDG